MRSSARRLHGPLRFPLGHGAVAAGRDLLPLLTSNHLYHDPPKLRQRLDADGYLFFKGMVPATLIGKAFEDVANQLIDNQWLRQEDMREATARDGFALDLPFPKGRALPAPTAGFRLTQNITDAIGGANVMTVMRQVLSGAVQLLQHKELELSYPGEVHGFHMDNIFQCRGTKLTLTAWVPLHNITLSHGGLVVARGSNSHDCYTNIRQTYGQYDIEAGDIHGDGSFTHYPSELVRLSTLTLENDDGELVSSNVCPLLSSAFSPGDIVILPCYTMHSFLTNTSNFWRISGETKWVIEGDDVGPDPRFVAGADGKPAAGNNAWAAARDDKKRYPRSMLEAKKAWGLVKEDEEGRHG